jgi:hypothetical protein
MEAVCFSETLVLPRSPNGVTNQKTNIDIFSAVAECHGRAVTTPASYSGGPGLKSRPEDRLSSSRLS